MLNRREFLQLGAASAISPFPTRPITLLVPWSAGGGTDLTMRVLADIASSHLGQRIVIENRPGAGGTLAMPALTQAAADGHTLAQMPQTVFRAPWTQRVQWDPVRDTTAILQISSVTFGFVTPASSPITSIAEMLAWAKKHPGELSVATNGVGTTPHVLMDDWFSRLGLSYIHVPYKGVSEQMLAVASGQVMVGIGANGIAPYVDSGKVRLLATTASRRMARWPQVPTLAQTGHPIVARSAYGIAGPKGMPESVVRTLHDALRQALLDPRHLAELAKYDQEAAYLNSADYAAAMREHLQAERGIVQRLGL